MIIQTNPPIWVMTPLGEGFAHFIIDYGVHLNSMWKVALFETGEVINVDDAEIRVMGNEALNIPMPKPFKERNI